jgi:hypothetical protein
VADYEWEKDGEGGDDGDESDELPDDAQVFDISKSTIQSWENKDRTTATVRMGDPTGLNDMKIYLLLRAKLHQMELDMGIHAENDTETH